MEVIRKNEAVLYVLIWQQFKLYCPVKKEDYKNKMSYTAEIIQNLVGIIVYSKNPM